MKRTFIRLSLLLIVGALACAVAYQLIGVRVDADGIVREAFPLIPIGFFLGGAGVVTGIAGLLWRKDDKHR
ncbi:DUF3955 domain-containing protein [Synechococcus sp. 1G10]|uniref:DUF3955 domain-containing protein n=1 Tax=Synechococcus sp. 1G10 TaxID=2025605 RepID=UPI000B98A382|nr:DUF3955 domain-containing protein [Synechococcus sp. 1G10]